MKFLKWKLRGFSLWLEYRTSEMVVPRKHEAVMLIENTLSPDFVKYNEIVEEMSKNWGKYDCEIESMKALGRLRKFTFEHKKP